METDKHSILHRYLPACIVASLVTLVILFVMTQLISPIGGDPVVKRMLFQLELQRRQTPAVPSGIKVFELPPKPEDQPVSDRSLDADNRPQRPEPAAYNDDDVEETRGRVINWWAEARAVIQGLGDAEFEEWLESQGFKKWVSVMQGPMPTSGGTAVPAEDGKTRSAYRNIYGDLELPISKNCVMQMQPRPFDSSDFSRNVPPRIVCKGTTEMDLSGLGKRLDRGATE